MNLKEFYDNLERIKNNFEKDISNKNSLEEIRNKYIGRNSELGDLLKKIKLLEVQDRSDAGSQANSLKIFLESKIQEMEDKSISEQVEIDPTASPFRIQTGHMHFTSQAIDEISRIFEKIGFYRERYPEVEWDWYAFEALNMPKDHPARDEWETFFVDSEETNEKYGKRVLTPHTSSGQIREMLNRKPPIRMINISKCYRRQIDISHTPMFHQFEGLVVDKGINISNLKGVLDYFVKQFFGEKREARIRPYHFRFTEPSFEVDVSCGICGGKGCRLCKEGWLEIGGAGMVHPNVLKACEIDHKVYSGFAFGFGIERNFMMKSGITVGDIRLIYQNDIRFLKQF